MEGLGQHAGHLHDRQRPGRPQRWKKDGKRASLFTAGFKTGKGSPYEGGTHVPAFWRWKGVLGEGKDIGALVRHFDLFKTFCELAGAEIPDGIQKIDGRSLVPLLENPKAEWEDRNIFIHCGRWPKGENPDESRRKKFAVRNQRWRLVGEKELFDISNDPLEDENVFDQHPEVVAEMLKAYDAWWDETRPLMVNEDLPYAKEHPQDVRYEKQLKEQGIPDWVPPEI